MTLKCCHGKVKIMRITPTGRCNVSYCRGKTERGKRKLHYRKPQKKRKSKASTLAALAITK